MPNWNNVLLELQANSKGPQDRLRHKYLSELHKHTGRNVLVYYSGWLQKPQLRGVQAIEFHIVDSDKSGFMTCSTGVDRKKGLDLLLHTPGGDIAATESLIDYLHSLYKGNVRAIIPQMAMSGGTLIALSCKSIIMGRQSSIGPVDPQIANMPAQGVLEEFALAADEIKKDPSRIAVWQPVISKYWPTLITNCRHAVDWSDQLLKQSLSKCMLKGLSVRKRASTIRRIANLLGKQQTSKSHNRHISPEAAKDLGINVEMMEDDQKLQDLVLTLHHTLSHTFTQTNAVKIIENNEGVTYAIQAITVQGR